MVAIAKHADRFTEARIDDEIVVMRLDNGEFFSIAGTGRAIWSLIDGTRDRAALLAALSRRFAAPAATLAADLDTFLVELGEADLIAVR